MRAKKAAPSFPCRGSQVAIHYTSHNLVIGPWAACGLSKTKLLFSPELAASLSDFTDTLYKQSSLSDLVTDS